VAKNGGNAKGGGQGLPPGFYRVLGYRVFLVTGLFFCLPVTDRFSSR
jgi:hypothetical protein